MSFTGVVSGETAITARGPLRAAAERVLGRLWIDEVPVRLASEDPALWPSARTAGAEGRALCWPSQPGPGRAALGRAEELRGGARADGLTEVVLLGHGAPARAAELIVAAHRLAADDADGDPGLPIVPLTVLDGPEPGPLLRLADDPERLGRALIVVTGDDPASDALRQVLEGLLRDGLGLPPAEAARRFVTVAEPRAAAAKHAAEAGHPLIEAPAPTAFGALSPYALVPAALAGADVPALLDGATAVLPSLTRPENNPGLVLGAILGGAVRAGRRTAVLGGYPAALPGLARWVALLLEETAGGRLTPVVQDGGLPLRPADDLFLVTFDGRPRQDDATVTGPLAAQLVVWEYAAAVAAYLMELDPLAPRHGAAPLSLDDGAGAPLLTDGAPGRAVEAFTTVPELMAAPDLPALMGALAARIGAGEHLAIVAYLDPDEADGQGAQVRRLAALLAARSRRPVTVDWDAGHPAIWNDHRDGGVYLMVTGNVVRDVPVPGRHHRLGMLQLARALGDARDARAAGRPVVRLHLQDRRAGLARLLGSAREGD
ncbi:glucose-6-phosphate isomerase [Actinomadura sp. KC216]|uniref:glucose-6-phosphate isomerase n=1 Tax=Actinomadura sp. KC216 TaxID=2530370 RepID=UPI00104F2014|nr:glucose-6-phosphate isomerase [Actinomadura sp. KC216]TDB89921.1 glucose-6-phosphate isomerase [Actinomadura sp. KC216]